MHPRRGVAPHSTYADWTGTTRYPGPATPRAGQDQPGCRQRNRLVRQYGYGSSQRRERHPHYSPSWPDWLRFVGRVQTNGEPGVQQDGSGSRTGSIEDGSSASVHSVLVCHHDPAGRSSAAGVAEAAGLANVGEVSLVTEVITMIGLVDPDIVILDRRSGGFTSLATLRELVQANPAVAFLVLNDDPASAKPLGEAGATAVAEDRNRADLERAIAVAVSALGAERGVGAGRRSGEDRRKAQDWSKVTSERRAADRRHQADRRTDGRSDSERP